MMTGKIIGWLLFALFLVLKIGITLDEMKRKQLFKRMGALKPGAVAEWQGPKI